MQTSKHTHTGPSKVWETEMNIRQASQTKMWWRKREDCDSDIAPVIIGSVSTLSSGRRIFPRAAGSSDGAQRLREQPRECKRVRVEVIPHSRLNELARLFRQLKQNDPLPIHILISPVCSTADGFTSLPDTLRYSLKLFYITLLCTYFIYLWYSCTRCLSQL